MVFRYAKTSTSGFSYSATNCPYRLFARDHPQAARSILEVPPYSFELASSSPFQLLKPKTIRAGETLERYLLWRGWDVERKMKLHNLKDDMVDSAVGLLTHPLTFPLTSGRHSNAFIPESSTNDPVEIGAQRSVRLCCVGARAECTLPDDYWREFLIVSREIDFQRNRNLLKAESNNLIPSSVHWIIDFVGPDVPKGLQSKSITLLSGDESALQRQTDTLTLNYHASFFQELVLKMLKQLHTGSSSDQKSDNFNSVEDIERYWNGFILFNPGLGHSNLQKAWISTLKFILQTKTPVLFTANSKLDAERDLSVLKHALTNEIDRLSSIDNYQVNPYASRMEFIDPFAVDKELGSFHIVRPNHYFLLLE